jgi:hypothetical protein
VAWRHTHWSRPTSTATLYSCSGVQCAATVSPYRSQLRLPPFPSPASSTPYLPLSYSTSRQTYAAAGWDNALASKIVS